MEINGDKPFCFRARYYSLRFMNISWEIIICEGEIKKYILIIRNIFYKYIPQPIYYNTNNIRPYFIIFILITIILFNRLRLKQRYNPSDCTSTNKNIHRV